MALIKVCDVCGIKEDNCAKPMWKLVLENTVGRRPIDICPLCLDAINRKSKAEWAKKGDNTNGKKV